ncbi:hypothetical protein ACH5RR_038402 [Cinchona calisaya]|uniref:Uncharacterized protein n=1 Tax=Cinchona calisaya TaxID=153742 RepID=A0ABD2Y0X1_9GENT
MLFSKKMKGNHKDSEKFMWDHPKTPSSTPIPQNNRANLPKLRTFVILFFFVSYVVYTLKLLNKSRSCEDGFLPTHHHTTTTTTTSLSVSNTFENVEKSPQKNEEEEKTRLEHIIFGIAASAKLWEKRKNYIKIWWRKREKMRGIVWLDNPVKTREDERDSLPELRISGDTSKFSYKNRQGHRSAIRISRIVSETLRLGNNENVRWFVMGDDDTVFVTENLVRILNKYDHNQYYYIGGVSESHLQNIYFSYGMAYGGGGFAISYPLAKALEKIQDGCIQRYPGLYGSDDRMQACMAELGVPLTKESGFHQYDVYGNLFGLLAAHPVAPFVTLHHLDVVEPIFPNVTRVQALQRLLAPMKLDSAGLMQQSICYDSTRTWTVSVSWGYAIQIIRGVLSPREIEMPSRTFLNWYRRADYTAYAFNTRPVMRNPCQKPFVFYLSRARMDSFRNVTFSEYVQHPLPQPSCKWKMADPSQLDKVEVYKKPDPQLWDNSPRRNCCRILDSKKKSLAVEVGVCREGETSVIQRQ